jgi:hypothetical protein
MRLFAPLLVFGIGITLLWVLFGLWADTRRRRKVVKGRWRVRTEATKDGVLVYARDSTQASFSSAGSYAFLGGTFVRVTYCYPGDAPAEARADAGDLAALDDLVRRCQEWCNQKNEEEAVAKAMTKRAKRQAAAARRRARQATETKVENISQGPFTRLGKRILRKGGS